ncbi:MAG: DUF956 family protein [Candidatus Schmidhempelia sp.]|nr:DUF956 family protein [Candidatus Schmidhempelia sp.]
MVHSLNKKANLIVNGTLFLVLPQYGKIMVGDNAFEFYHHYNSASYIQIPWGEIELVQAMVLFKGKWIPRYTIQTKQHGKFIFASKQPKSVLKAMRSYLGHHKMVKSPTLFNALKSWGARCKIK